MKQQLLKKIEEKSITVGVVGLGYVGLPLAVEKAKAGFKTIGFDVQDEKVKLVNEGHNYIGDVVDSDLKELVESKMLTATTDFSFVKDVDFVEYMKQKEVLFIKNDIKKIENSKVDYSKIITYYRRKLVDYGVIRELKNSYKSKGKYTGIINKEDRVVA